MPRVPSYQPNQIQEQVTPAVQSNVQVSREALGGGQSAARSFEAASGLAQQAAKTAIDVKRRINETLTKEGDSLFSKLQIDTATKIKSLQGRNAAQFEPYLGEFDKGVEDIINRYDGDDEAKQILKSVAQARRMDLYKDANTRMVSELEKYEAETHNSHLSQLQNEAIYYYQDQSKFKARIGDMRESIIARGFQAGEDEKTIQDKLAKAESQTYLKTIQQMIVDGRDAEALEFFKKEARLYGDDVKTGAALIDDTKLRYESTRKSDQIIGGSTSMGEALEKARNIDDPKLRDETISRVKSYYSDKKAAEQQDTEMLHRRATDFLDKNPNVDLYASQNPADWSRFSVGERASLKAYANKIKSGEDIETNFQLYYDLRLMASGTTEQQNQFLKIDLTDPKILNGLSKSDRETMVDLQTKLRSGNAKTRKELDGYRSTAMIVNDELKSAGIDPNAKKGSEAATRVARFRAMVDQRLTELQSRTGKPATTDEVQSVVSTLLTPAVVERGIFWDTKRPVFEIDPGQDAVFKYDDIPLLDRQQIESLMRQVGEPITEESVIQYWINKSGLETRGQ